MKRGYKIRDNYILFVLYLTHLCPFPTPLTPLRSVLMFVTIGDHQGDEAEISKMDTSYILLNGHLPPDPRNKIPEIRSKYSNSSATLSNYKENM